MLLLSVVAPPAPVAGQRACADGAFSIRIGLPGPDGTIGLDPSGVVKGWAVDRAAGPLRALTDPDFGLRPSSLTWPDIATAA